MRLWKRGRVPDWFVRADALMTMTSKLGDVLESAYAAVEGRETDERAIAEFNGRYKTAWSMFQDIWTGYYEWEQSTAALLPKASGRETIAISGAKLALTSCIKSLHVYSQLWILEETHPAVAKDGRELIPYLAGTGLNIFKSLRLGEVDFARFINNVGAFTRVVEDFEGGYYKRFRDLTRDASGA